MAPAGRRIGIEGRDTSSASGRRCGPSKRHAEQVSQAEVVRWPPVSSIQRVSRTWRARCRRASRSSRIAAHCASDSAAASGEDQQLEAVEAIRRQERLVHELERHARFDERVIHAEHVICRRDRPAATPGWIRRRSVPE